MLSEKKRVGETCLDENMKGQVTDRTQERKDLREAWVSSPAHAVRSCREEQETLRRVALSKTKNEPPVYAR